jgi:hypothetical protein
MCLGVLERMVAMFDEEIDESHPMRCDSDDCLNADLLAMKLVGERHEKRELVNLVRWLVMDGARCAREELFRMR